MRNTNSDITPMVALFWLKCGCGQVVSRGGTYYAGEDKIPMCEKCALPEPKERRLRLIAIRNIA